MKAVELSLVENYFILLPFKIFNQSKNSTFTFRGTLAIFQVLNNLILLVATMLIVQAQIPSNLP